MKYLRPYRGRIYVSIACVIVIAGLWGGGLGLVYPGAKVLLEPEGLHGWAYTDLSQDHLGAKLVEHDPGDTRFDGEQLDRVLNLTSITEQGPSGKAGLAAGNWIVGLNGHIVRGKALLKELATVHPGDSLSLRVFTKQGLRDVALVAGPESQTSGALRWLAERIPEPKSYLDRYPLFLGLLGMALALTLVKGVFSFFQEYLTGTAIWLGILDLRNDNYNVVLHLPTTFFSEKGASDATSRFVQDTNELARGQNTLLGKTMVEPAKAVGALVLAIACSWQLTLMALVAGPPAFWVIRRFGKKMHKASKRALESWSGLLGVLSETLLGIRVVKAYTMEGAERRRFFRVGRQLLRQQIRKERYDAATAPTMEALGALAIVTAAVVAGYMVFSGHMDRDRFLTWMVALFALLDPARKLAKVSMRFSEADAAAKRIFDLQDTPVEPHVANAPTLPRHGQSIEFRGVSFHYPGCVAPVLTDINFTVQAGEQVAIVGPNGSGKTTLLSLLPRLINPTAGQILIDGHDISQYSVRSLRRQIGLVTQDSVLFHASVADNIAYGLRRPKREAVLAASRKAFVDEFVAQMPNSYETMVGEHGTTLSGGQRQRISIARAILRDPAILIFDEAMSQVDSDSEQKIHRAMSEFVQGRTTLLIAHRFRTVMEADRIVVLAEGQIIDSGTHAELLARCQLYAHLYRSQLSE